MFLGVRHLIKAMSIPFIVIYQHLFFSVQPEKGSPRIKVSKNVMSNGQQALVECWSDPSKPAADLQFFINGNRVSVRKVNR